MKVKQRMSWNRAIMWFFLEVVLPLLPILMAAILLWLQHGSVSYIDLARGPEAFLFCTVVTASTLGGLAEIRGDFRSEWFYTVLVGVTIVLLAYSAGFFGVFFYWDRAGVEPYSREAMANFAVVSVIAILIACALCQWFFVSRLREVG